MINEKQVIETLKAERSKNPALDAVCTVFAARQRARDRVTMQALVQRMKEEGFLYPETDYAKVLELFAKLGLGRLDADSTGKVRALRDVKVTLQSLGLAAAGHGAELDKNWRRNRFQKIPVIKAAPITKESPKIELQPANYTAGIKERVQPRPGPGIWEVLCVPMKSGNTFKTYVPKDLTPEDAELIGKALKDMAKNKA